MKVSDTFGTVTFYRLITMNWSLSLRIKDLGGCSVTWSLLLIPMISLS